MKGRNYVIEGDVYNYVLARLHSAITICPLFNLFTSTTFLIGRTDIVETLLDAGMDPNCFDGVSSKCPYTRNIMKNALINATLNLFVGSCPLHEAVRFFRYFDHKLAK